MVAREPGHGAHRLAQRQRPVRGAQPALLGAVGVGDRLRAPRVPDDDLEARVPVEGAARPDGQLLALAAEAGAGAVDGDGVHVEALEVEVQGGEVLGGAGVDRRGAGEAAVGGVVGEGEVVVGDVVAAVARLREVRVARAVVAGALGPGAGPARGEHHREQGGGSAAQGAGVRTPGSYGGGGAGP